MKNPPGWKKNTETMPESPAEVLPLSPATWWQALRALAHEYHHEVVLVASLSALLLVASAIALPFIVVKMRPDYFMPDKDLAMSFRYRHPALRALGLVLKNTLGAMLLVVGIAMLVLPGQGILTILMGLMLSDVPGKRRLELWLVKRPPVLRALNWMREKGGKEPFELPM